MANNSLSGSSDGSVVLSDIINETVEFEEIVFFKDSHQHFDLNLPISIMNQIGSSEFSHSLGFHQSTLRNEVEGRIFVKEEKQEEIETNQISGNQESVNLYLKFPPPLMLSLKDATSTTQPQPSSSCKLLVPNSRQLGLHDRIKTEPDEPSLVLMGCYCCLLYVMVSEVDPVCPRCKSATSLVDVLHGSCRRYN